MDIVSRELRVKHDMFVTATNWLRFGQPEGLFPEAEFTYGIHGGDIETSLMLHLHPGLVRVGSSFQFRLPDHDADAIRAFVARCAARGVELKWFGAARATGFTSTYRNWAYAEPPELPQTDRVMAGLLDMRLPLTFAPEDCALIAEIIREEV